MERQAPCPGAEKGGPSLGETQDQVGARGQSPRPLPSWASMEEAEGKGWLAVNPPPSPLLPTVHQQAWQRKPVRLAPLIMTLLGLPLVTQMIKNMPAVQETRVQSGHGNPLWYSFLENSMDRGAWWATVHGVAKSRTRLGD